MSKILGMVINMAGVYCFPSLLINQYQCPEDLSIVQGEMANFSLTAIFPIEDLKLVLNPPAELSCKNSSCHEVRNLTTCHEIGDWYVFINTDMFRP